MSMTETTTRSITAEPVLGIDPETPRGARFSTFPIHIQGPTVGIFGTLEDVDDVHVELRLLIGDPRGKLRLKRACYTEAPSGAKVG